MPCCVTGSQNASLFCWYAIRLAMPRGRKRAVESPKHKQARQANAHNTRADRVGNRAAGQACSACCTCLLIDQLELGHSTSLVNML